MDSKSEMEENISSSSSSSSDDCPNPDHTETPQRQLASDKHDDACMICADGGSLLCCDMCSSTYHQDCMDMDVVPEGAWLCPYCVCKFCGNPCGANDYLVTCFQSEKRYHWECYQERNLESIDVNSPSTPLCEQSCKELDDLYQIIECHSKLAVARIVMEECFEPIKDRNTKINVIRNVVYNRKSNYTRTNFSGFHSAILEKDDEIISVASVRIHGTKLAEMPFIATRESYRSQGMCRRLMVAIESITREVREVENNEPQNGPNLLGIAAREVHEVENNEHQNGSVFENKLPMQAIFDLNMELTEKDGVNEDSDITSNNTH
ncbi:hypothetical protein TEA_019128 [Camellia sinensis var. sinensis]|uniref:PHD-type domain-containing protein n=1 Tax=Camellia sinensis var. sinensis TaxID=542762 RepID=A0A4S4DA47_CAMSN|nr:hypothetical protein TEA_019128 [Camellia sinensis var. sinensis]